MVHEIILAIDPTLQKIEEILLWKNKILTSVIFTTCNISLWLLYSFNIRTYCTIFSIALIFHLLDAYRTKIRKKLRVHHNRVHSIIGKYFINAYDHGTLLYQRFARLRQQNRIKYFAIMLVIWVSLAIFGLKVKGFYIAYCAFWIIFFIPAIIHYNVPGRILSKAVPLLEQLDRSMEYERRSVLDKKDLLVDVQSPTSEIDDEQIEDEYLHSFKLDEEKEMKLKRRSDKINSEENDDSSEVSDESEGLEEEEEEEEYDENGSISKTDEDDDIVDENVEFYDDDDDNNSKIIENNNNTNNQLKRINEINDENDDENNEFLPNEFDFKNAHFDDDSIQYENNRKILNDSEHFAINKVVKVKKIKNRPSLLDYYSNASDPIQNDINQSKIDNKNNQTQNYESKIISTLLNVVSASFDSAQQQQLSSNDRDIDDTFDFLDEELNKYPKTP